MICVDDDDVDDDDDVVVIVVVFVENVFACGGVSQYMLVSFCSVSYFLDGLPEQSIKNLILKNVTMGFVLEPDGGFFSS